MKLIKKADNWYNLYDGDVGIGSTHVDLQGYRLSLNNCLEIDRGYDLNKMANDSRSKVSILFEGGLDEKSHRIGFKAGWQQAINLMADKKFSRGQLLNAMDLVWQWVNGEDYGCETLTEVQDKYIQSLQQTEWEVEIKMQRYLDGYEMVGSQKGVYGSGNRIPIYKSATKLDENGCIILKRIT
jgi:hypothetical protein